MLEAFLSFLFVEFNTAGLLLKYEAIIGFKRLFYTPKAKNFLLIEVLHFIGLL